MEVQIQYILHYISVVYFINLIASFIKCVSAQHEWLHNGPPR